MPSLLDIGTKPGTAAHGEFSPKALLDSRGAIIVCDSNGNPVKLARAAAGLFLGSDGSDTLGRIPPGYPIIDLGRAFTGDGSTTPEASLLAGNAGNANVAAASLFAAGVAVGDFWDISLRGTLLNNSGTSTYTSTIKVYHGALAVESVVSAALTSSATVRAWGWDLRLLVETVGAANVGTLRISGARWGLDTVLAVGTGYRAIPASVLFERAAESTGTSASLATNAARDFNVTATHSNASASITTTLTECTVRHYPKNR